jgi:RNA polymerase sigma-70 factor (ECF subfamily)
MADERQRLVRYACCRLGNSEDAEDAIQDLFLQFHERMKKTDNNDSLSTDIKNQWHTSIAV